MPQKTMVLPALKFMEIKVPILGTQDILINNVLSRRNDYLEPKVIILIFLVSSSETFLTSEFFWLLTRNLRIKFHNFCCLHTCRSTPELIYSVINYVFLGNFLSYETLPLSRKNIYDRIKNKISHIFLNKSLKQHQKSHLRSQRKGSQFEYNNNHWWILFLASFLGL